jgi:glycosyltransferase involved in cell wall biosynthesis
MMRWGLIARAESNRGLGVLTRLMYENLSPDSTLVVRVEHEYRQDVEVFPGATVVDWSGGDLPETEIREWLDGLDVVVSAETFYDWRVVNWAREQGVRTVLYVMPELFKRELFDGTLPMPDQFWYPSLWTPHPGLPAGDYLPVPCEQRPFVNFPDTDVRVIHVAGKPALADRNGTNLVALASKRAQPGNLTVYGQGALPRFHSNVRVLPGPENKWEMYESAHVLVMPRRYGGLCLPVIEALSCGLAVAMPDIPPNATWPIKFMGASADAVVEMPVGPIQTYVTDLTDLRVALSPSVDGGVEHCMLRSRQWAEANTWDKQRHTFYEALR